jgi:signal peptidase II
MEAAEGQDVSRRPVLVLAAVAAVVLVLDQLTKAAIVATTELGARISVIGDVIELRHHRNTGAAFSLLEGQLWLFLVVTVLGLGMIVYFHRSLRGRALWLQVVLGLILGGTLGNFVDRVRYGYVVDFVSVGIGELRWPTFNVADASLVVGILLLVAYLTLTERRANPHDGPPQGRGG